MPSERPDRAWRWLSLGLLTLAALFYGLHFLHLSADFPSDNGWQDWSRYTDEGWYSDAAVRYRLFGHWFLPGDFNPAVALPVWPLLEALVFAFTGASLAAARALAVGVFGVTLIAVYRLLTRAEQVTAVQLATPGAETSLAAPLAVVFLSLSPFFFAFDRLAILEPLLAALTLLTMLCTLHLNPPGRSLSPGVGRITRLWPPLALGVLLPTMVLTKPTAIALFPSIFFLFWARAGYRLLPALRLALVPALVGACLWLAYFFALVRPHYLEDYRYLFAANEYTGFQTTPLAEVISATVADGVWMGTALYLLFFALLAILVLLRPRFFRNPLVPALLLWVAGTFAFLAYHNNLQARYYLLLALPITLLVAMALEAMRRPQPGRGKGAAWLQPAFAGLCVAAIALPDAAQQIGFLLHPSYTFRDAAVALARRVRAEPAHSSLVLSVSGSDLTLMTGLPSINTEFGTMDLDERVRTYRPGWYVAWNEVDDEDMKAIAPLYRFVPVASYPAMDDPDRNLLRLYRLDPVAK